MTTGRINQNATRSFFRRGETQQLRFAAAAGRRQALSLTNAPARPRIIHSRLRSPDRFARGGFANESVHRASAHWLAAGPGAQRSRRKTKKTPPFLSQPPLNATC